MTRKLLVRHVFGFACLVWVGYVHRVAAATGPTACSAADIVAQDPGCPAGTGPCTITKTFAMNSACTLDFGARDVTLTGTLDVASGTLTLLAGSLTITPTGFVDGRGNDPTDPTDTGGDITIQTTGLVTLQKNSQSRARIDVSGNGDAGSIDIEAGGTVTIGGRIDAIQLTSAAGGGEICIVSQADVLTLAGSEILATGGRDSEGGGDIEIDANGNITLQDVVDSSGSDGGTVTLNATLGRVQMGRVNVNGIGDAGSGGLVTVTAGTEVDLLDDLTANGNTSSTGAGGGDGGDISFDALFGNLNLQANVLAIGAAPDGAGGSIDGAVDSPAVGNVVVGTPGQTPAPKLSVRGDGTSSGAGTVTLQTDGAITIQGPIDASGGAQGGEVDIDSGTNMALGDVIDASGRAAGSVGGHVGTEAGHIAAAGLVVSRRIDVRGGSGGTGGRTDLTACQLRIDGEVHAESTTGGVNVLTARSQLTVNGKVFATGTQGGNNFVVPTGSTPSIGAAAVVSPAAALDTQDLCTATSPINCLMPCPVCGNGVVEFPETCDDGQANPTNCDGCSAACQIQSCDDGLVCTIDSCDPVLGCQNAPVLSPCVEPPTATPTPIPTPTVTPTAPPSVTPTPTLRPTRLPTRTPTPIRTQAGVATATATPTPNDIGDNNCDGRTTVADVTTASETFDQTPDGHCPNADVNGDGVVDALDITFTIMATFNEFQ